MKLSMVIAAVSVGVVGALGVTQLSAYAQPDKAKAPAAPVKKDAVQPVKDAVQPHKDGAPAAPDMDKMMAEMAKYSNPGPEHKRLAEMVGTWDCAAKFWMPGKDGKIEEHPSKGQATFTSELGGRWIRQNFSGDFMGDKFEGIGFSGYDSFKKQYVGTWMDTMSTCFLTMTGTYDEATKTQTMTTEYEMPMMGKIKSRHVGVAKDANTYIYTMYSSTAGAPEVKEGEITYTRRK
jgi:hypothetical protein